MSLNPNNSQVDSGQPLLPQSVSREDVQVNRPFLAKCLNAVFEKKTRLVIEFSRNVATMLEAGLPIDRILCRQRERTTDGELREVIEQLQQELATGRSFAQAIAMHPDYFGHQFTSVITAGELSGKLVFALKILADYMERGLQLRNKLYATMAEPLFTLLVMLLNAALMLGFVLPAVIDAARQALGESVGWLLMVSWVSHFGLPLIAIFAVLLMAMLQYMLSTEMGQVLADRIGLRVPVIGALIRNLDATYFTMSLLMGYASGLSLPIAAEMAVESMASQVLKAEASVVNERLADDMSLTQALEGRYWIPVEVRDMIEVGEESGTLEKALTMALDFLTREIDDNIALLKSLVKPLMMLAAFLLFGIIFSVVIGTIGLTITQSLDEVMRIAVPQK